MSQATAPGAARGPNTSTKPEFNPSGDPVISTIKHKTDDLMAYIEKNVTRGRRRQIALTNFEDAAMWAVKAQAYPGE